MATLRVGSQRVNVTDEALKQIEDMVQNAFLTTPGIFLHFRSRGTESSKSVWVSPASEIVLSYDRTPERNSPDIFGFDAGLEMDSDAL